MKSIFYGLLTAALLIYAFYVGMLSGFELVALWLLYCMNDNLASISKK